MAHLQMNDCITAVPGLRCSVGTLGIKANGQADAALFELPEPAVFAGVFTTNQFRSACVESAVERLHGGKRIRAVLITSGNANAGTGLPGRADTELLAAAVGEQLACQADQVIVLHTGVIGIPLHAERLVPQIPHLTDGLAATADAGLAAARAIMTTDTVPKMAVRRVTVGDREATVAGVAKGAGMIHPRLATMLSVIVTDVPLHPSALQAALVQAVQTTFNAISVDGDTSPNDSVVLLSTGGGGGQTSVDDASYASFCRALTEVCEDLSKMIVRDGEGATKFIEIAVRGAERDGDAEQIAATIATSPLVKTAFYGEDFNPGRIISAMGRSGVTIEWEKTTVHIGDLCVFTEGVFALVSSDDGKAVMAGREIVIAIDLNSGGGECRFFTCDLTHDYVRINGEYTT